MRETLFSNRFSIFHRGPAKGPDYDSWREGICRGFCRLDVGPAEDDFIDCRNDFALMDCVAMATPAGRSARFARTRDLLADDCDDLVLISASHGKVRVTQGRKTIDLQAGQMCLTEMNVVGAADLTSLGAFKTTRFPRRILLQVSRSAETQLARPLGHDRGMSALIDRYFELCNEVAGDLDPLGQKAAALHLIDLVGLLLGTSAEQKDLIGQRGLTAARLDLLKAYILKNLEDGTLSVETTARANALSERQIQRLFALSGATFSEFVLEQRLLSARHRLQSAVGRQRKVSDIAFAAGFNDLSYFNRTFRKRFGLTPSELLGEADRTPEGS